jgi:hypothetical protein
MTVIEMPKEPERRYVHILDAEFTLDEMLGLLGDVVDSKIKYGKCTAEARETEITYLMYVFWHRERLTATH